MKLMEMKQKARLMAKLVKQNVGQAFSLSAAYGILAQMEGEPNWNVFSSKLLARDVLTKKLNTSTIAALEICMPDVIGEYDDPDKTVEWQWVVQHHTFAHKGNGVDSGVYEYMVNVSLLEKESTTVPQWLGDYYQLAKNHGYQWLMFYQ